MCQEREHLLPLAEEGFDLAGVHFADVNGKGCVRVLTNFYSAPAPVGTEVQAKVHAAYVEICIRAKASPAMIDVLEGSNKCSNWSTIWTRSARSRGLSPARPH
jgi:hypothetical protein